MQTGNKPRRVRVRDHRPSRLARIPLIPLISLLLTAATAQVPEGALANWVEQGVLSPEEAVAVEEHIAHVGFPVTKEEVAAISGLSAAAAERLASDPLWMRWSSTEAAGQRSRLTVLWDADFQSRRRPTDSVAGPGYGIGLRAQRAGHWGLRLDRGAGESGIDHVAGFVVAPTVRGVQTILGDHVIRWGQGLVGWSASAFDGMRSATAAQRLTQPVRPVLAGDALAVRRGLALRIPQPSGNLVLSCDIGGREARLEGGLPVTWYRDGQHRTPSERGRTPVRPLRFALLHQHGPWGLTTEWGHLNGRWSGLAGLHATAHRPQSRWAAELAASPRHLGWALGCIATLSARVDGFFRWERPMPEHPAEQWGDARSSTPTWHWGAQSRTPQSAHFFRWQWRNTLLTWEHQSQWTPRRRHRYRLRTQGAAGWEQAAIEGRWDGTPCSIRCWVQIDRQGGKAAGVLWSWDVHPNLPKWRVGWAWGDLAPGEQAHYLEPNARAWQTAVLSGASARRWVQGSWKWGHHWKVSASWSHLERHDVQVLPASGPWEWRGNARSEWRVRLAYAM